MKDGGARMAAGGDDPGRLVLIGTYAEPSADGIHVLRLDETTGALTRVSAMGGVKNPSFLAIHPSGRFVYAVSEMGGDDGKRTGAVAAFAFNAQTGTLERLNTRPSGGNGPCHVGLDRTGTCLVVANYGSGSVSAIPIVADGRLGTPGSPVQHEGSSVTDRQKGPHAHSIHVAPDGRYVIAADLGLDKLLVYRIDPRTATLAPNDPPFTSTAPGAGPRHFAFHPKGDKAYVINELDSTITVLDYDATGGRLHAKQTVSTLPEGLSLSGSNSTAEVQVHPTGRFVYGSNRGHDSVAVFSVNEASGELTLVGHQSTGGKTPRNFGIDPSGRFLLAANQASNNVVVFRLDPSTGMPVPAGHEATIERPVCVKFVNIEGGR